MDSKVIIARRLAFIEDDEYRAALADRYAKGEAIKVLANEAGLTTTRIHWCLVQDLTLRAEMWKEVLPERRRGQIWTCCEHGVTPARAKELRLLR